MIELTLEQHQEMVNSQQEDVRARDPVTNIEYVLLQAELFERLRALLGEDFKTADAYPALDRSFAENWNHPSMDDYNRYEEMKK